VNSEFQIAGIDVPPRTRKRGFLRVGPYFSQNTAHIRSYVLIPFTVIRGATDTPILAQTAGCHATEYAGIDATIRLSDAIKPEELKGTYMAVHCVNAPGFFERNYPNPIDGKNLQETYPGMAYGTGGTISDLMCYEVFNKVVLKANYFLDCHGGDIHESEVWWAIFYKTNDDVEKKSEAIARSTGLTYLSKAAPRPGMRSMGLEAAKKGIPGALFEIGEGDRLLPTESSAIFEGTLNVMRHLGMLAGELKKIKEQPATTEGQQQELWTSSASAYFTKGGLYHTDVKPGDLLKKGQVIGTVTNFWNEVIETIHAPETGRIGLMIHNPVVNPGETAVTVYS
jgi:predicted deacylase